MRKRILILILLLIFMSNVKAECDYTKEVQLGKEASNISYEYSYNYNNKSFELTLYNVSNNLLIMYNSRVLQPGYGIDSNQNSDVNTKNMIKITNIEEGTYLSMPVTSTTGSCYQSLLTIYVTIPYINSYYNSDDCIGYEDKIKVCSEEFLPYKTNINIIKDAINNYENTIKNDIIDNNEEELTLLNKILNEVESFLKKWGIKIGLSTVTIILCIIIYETKIRKIKHGL